MRKSVLTTDDHFRQALGRAAPKLARLEGVRIDGVNQANQRIASELWELIAGLGVVENDNPVVAGTKALHHLLPALVFPMDRTYTQPFFGWSNPEFQYHPEECFKFAFEEISAVARQEHPDKYVGSGWRTTPAKILDNAIVGYCTVHRVLSEGKKQRSKQKAMIARAKELGIWDQIEAEAKRRASEN